MYFITIITKMPPAYGSASYSFVQNSAQPLAGKVKYNAVHVSWHIYANVLKIQRVAIVHWRRGWASTVAGARRAAMAELEDLKGC